MPECIHYSNGQRKDSIPWYQIEQILDTGRDPRNKHERFCSGWCQEWLAAQGKRALLLVARSATSAFYWQRATLTQWWLFNMWCLHYNIHCPERDILHTKERVKCWMRISVRSSSGLTRFAHFGVSSKTFGRAASSAKSSITGGASLGEPYSMR